MWTHLYSLQTYLAILVSIHRTVLSSCTCIPVNCDSRHRTPDVHSIDHFSCAQCQSEEKTKKEKLKIPNDAFAKAPHVVWVNVIGLRTYLTVLAIAVAGFRLRNAFNHFVFIDVLDTDSLRSRSLRGGEFWPPPPPPAPAPTATAACPETDAPPDTVAIELAVVAALGVVLIPPMADSDLPKNKSFCGIQWKRKINRLEWNIMHFVNHLRAVCLCNGRNDDNPYNNSRDAINYVTFCVQRSSSCLANCCE